MTLADHAAGQEPDRLDDSTSQSGVEVFAFQLSNSTGATVTQNGFVFQLSSVNGMVQGDFDNFYIYVDADGSGDIEGGETTKVCAAEATTAISGATGTITFSGCDYDITDGTTVKMLLTGDLANLTPGDSFTIDLGTGDLTPAADGSDCSTTAHWVDGSNEYHYRRKITIDKDELGATCATEQEDLTDFPLLVTLTGSDFAGVALATGAAGHDIIFKDADGNRLDHEIEEFDETTDNRLVAWVKVPTVYYDRDTVIWMYYGNNSVTAATENPSGVWDDNFKGVWHLNEDVTDEATSGTHDDSTGANHGSQNGNVEGTGKFADGQDFDGQINSDGDYIDAGTSPGSATDLTISFWMKADVNDTYMRALGKFALDDAADQGWSFLVRKSGDTGYDRALIFRIGDDGAYGDWGDEITAEELYDANQWVHVVGTFVYNGSNGGTGTLYVDGSQVATKTNTDGRGVANTATPFYIGWDSGLATTGAEDFNGIIDEVRISDTARDACWIGTEYNNQNAPTTFYSISSEQVFAFTTATGQNDTVQVAWETATETGNLGFTCTGLTALPGPLAGSRTSSSPG